MNSNIKVFTDNIIRKSSISARRGERVLIPLNMADGSLVCVGKGNDDLISGQ